MLKKAAEQIHQANDGHKAKALKDDEAEKENIYRIKGKGQWSLAKSVGSKTLPPLTAVKRKQKGPKGEPVRSISSAQGEVDTIARKAYDEIYVGNKANQEQATADYLEQYKNIFFEAPQANISQMEGPHLKAMAVNAKESAAGMDQWARGIIVYSATSLLSTLRIFSTLLKKLGRGWKTSRTHERRSLLKKRTPSSSHSVLRVC